MSSINDIEKAFDKILDGRTDPNPPQSGSCLICGKTSDERCYASPLIGTVQFFGGFMHRSCADLPYQERTAIYNSHKSVVRKTKI